MRTVMHAIAWSCLAVLLASCGREAQAKRSDTTTVTTTEAPPETRLVVVSEAEASPPVISVAQDLIDHCVVYVPFGAGRGEFYMQVIWNMANQNVDDLRALCEEYGRTNPSGLANIDKAYRELEAFFNAFTTTIPLVPGATTTAPGLTVPACPAGSHLNQDGFCIAD
jgi:hypothetical protein